MDVRSFILELEKWQWPRAEHQGQFEPLLKRLDPVIETASKTPEWFRGYPLKPGFYFTCSKQDSVYLFYVNRSYTEAFSSFQSKGRWWREVSMPEKPWQAQAGCSKPGCGYPDGEPCIGCGRVVMPSLECVDGEGI